MLPAQGDCPLTAHSHLPFTPSQGDPPLTAGPRLPFTPSQGSSQSLLLEGLTHRLLPGLLSHILSLGSSGRLVPLRQIQSPVSRAASLGHTHRRLAHSPSDNKGPLGSRAPWLCLGAHPPLAWPFPLRAPAGSAGAPTAQSRLSAVLGRPHAVRWGLPHSTEASTRLPPSSLCMGSGWAHGPGRAQGPREGSGPRVGSGLHCMPGSHLILALLAGELLSACCSERALVHMPLPEAQGSGGQAPPRVWGSPGQVPAGLSTQELSTGPSLQSTPSPPVGQI